MSPMRLLSCAALCLSATLPGSAAIKIACVGDSITEGSGLGSPTTESYPAKLQRLLGSEFQVRNFGVSGRTLLKQGDFPYWKESAYTQSHTFNPDIVTIMLGTNDSKPYNWKYGTNFVANLQELISTYTNLPTQPRIFLCTPPPVYATGAFDIKPGTVATNIAPLVREVAASLGTGLIDLHVLLASHKEWFPDTVHPNTRGTTVFAAHFFTGLKGDQTLGAVPDLALTTPLATRAVLSWPAEWGGWVLQSAPTLREPTNAWTVVEQVAGNDGATIRITNTVSGTAKLYRLWNPAP